MHLECYLAIDGTPDVFLLVISWSVSVCFMYYKEHILQCWRAWGWEPHAHGFESWFHRHLLTVVVNKPQNVCKFSVAAATISWVIYNNRILFTHISGGQKPKTGIIRQKKWKCWPGWAPSRGSRAESVPGLFQLLEAAAAPRLWLPPSSLCLLGHTAFSTSSCAVPPPSYKNAHDCI